MAGYMPMASSSESTRIETRGVSSDFCANFQPLL